MVGMEHLNVAVASIVSLWEHSRPLFTILVLVVGVVGGLTLVITVVYFYRFCLKKRPPLTTTCRPEQKRDAVRSEASTACRPLPLPMKNGLYQTQPTIARLTQLDGRRIPQAIVDRPTLAQRDSNRSQNLPVLTYTSEDLHCDAGDFDKEGHLRGSLRSSAELLPTEDPDLRHPSMDAPKRRQLPSIEHLERGLSHGECHTLLMSGGERRRANPMVRTNAVLSPNAPVKQYQKEMMAKKNSSPLPQERRSIYTKDHLYSKSWNPDLHYDDDESYQQPPSTAATRYGAANQTVPYSLFPSTNPLEPRRTSNAYHLGVRQPFERQAKSFDERANERMSGWTEKRSQSEREDGISDGIRDGIQRQTTQQHEEALIAGTAIAYQCQSLWEARSHLEHLRRLGIEDPSSASTSFESNTEATLVSPRHTPMNGRESVDERRNKYRSLFLQRKTLPGQPVDSIESTFSNDSSMGFVDEMRRATLAQIQSIDSGDRLNEIQTRRPLRNQRDYSVDATSDSMFREFSRVDPKYEMFLHSIHPSAHRESLPNSSHFLPKWETFDAAAAQQKNRRLSTSRQMSQQHENYRYA